MSIDLSFPPENQDNVSPIWGALRPAGNGKLASAGIPVTDTAAAPVETNPDKAIAKPFGAARAAEIRAIAGSEPVLNQLARRIRDAHQAVRAATANALAAALDAGDALIEAKTRVETDWEGWVEKNCRFGASTARLYMQLARRREDIEAKQQDELLQPNTPPLSVRAARQLIAKPRCHQQKAVENDQKNAAETAPEIESEPVNLVLAALDKANTEQVTAALNAKGLLWLLEVMPDDFRSRLEQRVLSLRVRPGHLGDPKLTTLVRTALSHVVAADTPGISAPVKQSQELAALNTLRGLVRLNVDIHALAVGIQTARTRKQREV